ncbi:LLM class flavin-dependent oxidoreductase [Myxococcota bacterium]|jgi:alkanesulfonate monooxygenase SsuD/methylene tetrahydromethanopterin reductase-like flavin-dependent oxidoreductase (luciferase family)|nr:LLM class flavin-dependent oxidoreductase [Myxococcota bacterium]
MDFGVFCSAVVGPRPWEESEPERFRQDLEMGIKADEVGFDSFWAPEHHFLEEYSHNAASHLTCLAVGMRTERIRLVTGIMNLCAPINHPVRVAEQIAMIDIYTNGRIELGTGRGSGSTEVNSWGLQNEETKGYWEEAIRAIPKMWTQDLFSHDGEHFSVPERNILPKPLQKPHPPLWVTATNPDTVERAGRMGLGVAVFSFQSPQALEPLVETYKKAIADPDPISEVVNDKFLTIAPLLCLEDGDRARDWHARRANLTTAHFSVYFDTVPEIAARLADEPRPIPQTRLRELIAEAANDPSLVPPFPVTADDPNDLIESGLCVGDPEQVKRAIQNYADVGVDELGMIPRTSWIEPQEMILESLEVTGRDVLPSFR